MTSHTHTDGHQTIVASPTWPWVMLLTLLCTLYAIAWLRQPQGKPWDHRRSLSWYAGLAVAATALIGPLADAAHTDFSAHMLGHLLLGMLAPILLVLGSPITLMLRALPVRLARMAVGILSSPPLRILTDPVTAAVLNVGGLAILYRTDLYQLMHEHTSVYLLVHLHVLGAGYLFTAAMIGTDPIAHRPSYRFRVIVLILALGMHAILAKSLYVTPPAGVPPDQAQAGSQLMYYGGDIVDLGLIIIFCWQWYWAARPRSPVRPDVARPALGDTRGGAS